MIGVPPKYLYAPKRREYQLTEEQWARYVYTRDNNLPRYAGMTARQRDALRREVDRRVKNGLYANNTFSRLTRLDRDIDRDLEEFERVMGD